jgi:hypothetical protein
MPKEANRNEDSETNAKETYIHISNRGRNCSTRISNKSFENITNFRYFRAT